MFNIEELMNESFDSYKKEVEKGKEEAEKKVEELKALQDKYMKIGLNKNVSLVPGSAKYENDRIKFEIKNEEDKIANISFVWKPDPQTGLAFEQYVYQENGDKKPKVGSVTAFESIVYALNGLTVIRDYIKFSEDRKAFNEQEEKDAVSEGRRVNYYNITNENYLKYRDEYSTNFFKLELLGMVKSNPEIKGSFGKDFLVTMKAVCDYLNQEKWAEVKLDVLLAITKYQVDKGKNFPNMPEPNAWDCQLNYVAAMMEGWHWIRPAGQVSEFDWRPANKKGILKWDKRSRNRNNFYSDLEINQLKTGAMHVSNDTADIPVANYAATEADPMGAENDDDVPF